MRTILVPTDFSQLSKVALSFAIGVAKKIESRIIVMYVVSGVTSTEALANMKKYQDDLLATAKADGDKLMKEFKTEIGNLNVSYQYATGFPVVDVIEQFAVKNNVNMIVMGSKGATGLKKIVMGSNATAVIDHSSIPVLVIPAEANLKSITRLVYATDARDFHKEIKMVATFAEMLGAFMEVIHVVPEKAGKYEPGEGDVSAQKLKEMADYPNIHLHMIYDKDVSAGLETFINAQKDEFALVTFTHRLTFNEKLFGKSVTQDLAYHNSVPLLVVNRSNHKAF